MGERKAIRFLILYVLMTVGLSCLALLINIGIVYAFYTGLAPLFLTEAYAKKLGQLILLIVPCLLLYPEWLVYDMLMASWRQKHS